jgi:hypothetical protein
MPTPTNFAVPGNNVSTTLTQNYAANSNSLVVASATAFPTISGTQTITVTVCQVAFAYSPTASLSNYTIYKVTGISGTTLTIDSAHPLEGTTDRAYSLGDIVEVRVTAGTLSTIYTAVNALETAEASEPAGSNTQIQYNNSGAFGADANLTWTTGTGILRVATSTSPSSAPLEIINNATTYGTSSAQFGRSNLGSQNLFDFFYTADYSGSNPIWSMGTPPNSPDFVFTSYDTTNSSLTYLRMLQSDHSINIGGSATVKFRQDGTMVPVTMANASAANNSLFIDSSAGNKLCWKDSGGTLHYST